MSHFWDGFEKRAGQEKKALSLAGVGKGLKSAVSHTKAFGKGALVGAGATGIGMGIASAAKAPTSTQVQ